MTPEFSLRRIDPERDAPALHAIYGDEASCRYLADPATATVAETCALLLRWHCDPKDRSCVILDAEGSVAGRATMIDRGRKIYEAGVMLVPAARGRGLARMALARLIGETFAAGARRIYADIDPDNRGSVRLFERLGFQYEGRLRATWETHLGVRDAAIYALIDTDPRPFDAA